MHVLYIAGWYPDKEQKMLGIFIREHAIAASVFNRISVLYLQVHKSFKHFPYHIEMVNDKSDSVPVYRLHLYLSVRRFGWHDKMVKRAYAEAIDQIQKSEPIDVIHIHVRTHLTKLITELEAVQNIPIILSEHFSFYHTGIFELPLDQQQKERKEIRTWFQFPGLKYVLPVSASLGHSLVSEFGVNPSKINVIGNVAGKMFTYQPYKKIDKISIVLAAGWKAPKNPFLFIDALEQLETKVSSQLIIHWIGDGPQMNEIRNRIEKSKMESLVRFHGYLDKKHLADYLQQAAFFVHPTDSENLPAIIIESLCCGTPVLSVAVGGIPEMIDNENGLLARVKDPKDFFEKFIDMLNYWDQYDRKNIATQAQSKYAASVVGAKLSKIYKQVLTEMPA